MPAVQRGRVCVLGAGGPVGAVVAKALGDDYELRLVDIQSIDQICAAREDTPAWPRPNPPEPPHAWHIADVMDYDQVCQAIADCDAVINLTVNRGDVANAFGINIMAVYNIMKAAAELRPQRVIHGGVIHVLGDGFEGDDRYEFDIPDDAPIRPGTFLYPHTKLLGLEIVSTFAEREQLDVISLMLSRLRPGDRYDGRDDDIVIPYSVEWSDLGAAFWYALRAPQMPSPNERFFICTHMPMGKYAPGKAERLLGWRPTCDFRQFWRRDLRPANPT